MKRSADDARWSEEIRKRAGYVCEKCGKYYGPGHRGLHAAHIFGRGNKTTRWDLDNGVALCMKDHLYWAHSNPLEFAEWVKERMGQEKYDELMAKAKRVK